MRRGRGLVLAASVLGLTAALVAGALAGGGPTAVEKQFGPSFSSTTSTSSTSYSDLSFLGGSSLCVNGWVSVTVSGTATGGAFKLRVQRDSGAVTLNPGEAEFDPSGRNRSFSHTFVDFLGSAALKTYVVQWRSAIGDTVKLKRASANYLFGGACA